MKVNFTIPQTLQTLHPNQEICIYFKGTAFVTDTEEVRIISVSLNDEPLPIPAGYTDQNLATGEMGAFLGKCREAARKECQKRLQEEVSEDLKSNHHHNADFWPPKNIYPADLEDMADTNGGGGR